MNRVDYNNPAGGWGRDGDQFVAHIAPGETIVPPVISPELRQRLYQEMSAAGIPVEQYVVGEGMSINPATGMPEFGFGKFVKKAVKSVVKVANSVPVIGPVILPAVGAAVGGPAGAAIASGAQTKIQGGSWGQAIGAAAGSYIGGAIGGPGSGTIASNLNEAGYLGLTNTLGRELSNVTLSSISGSLLGSAIGTNVGGMIDAPKQPSWGSQSANIPTAPSTSTPTGGSTGGVAIPGGSSSDNANAPSGPTAEEQALVAQRGAGITVGSPTGVNYTATVIDRDTGRPRTINTSFSNNFDRRGGWGSGVSFA